MAPALDRGDDDSPEYPARTPAQRYAAFRDRQAHPELASFRALYDFEFDDFQLQACTALNSGDGVLVAAPTGSGKTVVGEFAVHLALERGLKCFYTTPIKALSNQKYADLVRRYDSKTVGLLTGDNSVNGEAPIVVMTTEVLRNMLYAGSPTLSGLGFVVLDEVHYLADRSRGAVWEEVIIHLPRSVAVAALSATVSNAEEFGDWLDSVRDGVTVIVDELRPVPLWQHMMVGTRLYDLFTDPAGTRVNPDLVRMAQRDRWAQPQAAVTGSSRPGRGGRRVHPGRRNAAMAGRAGGPRTVRARPPYRPDVVARLDASGLLPAIEFIFSRAGCDAAVQQCLAAGLRLTQPDEIATVTKFVEQRTQDIPDEDLAVLGYGEFLTGLQRGIAAHHAGMLPAFKEIVEELFSAGLVRVVFATETLALGINMPARSVVIEKLDKWNGETHAELTPGEYTQLTGRAGRRGIDVEGHAVVLWQPGIDPEAVGGLAGTRTYPLNSSFRPSYNMAVNLTGRVGRAEAATLLESSFAQFQADRGVVGLARQVRRNTELMAELTEKMACDQGDFVQYADLRRQLSDLETDQSRRKAAARRVEAARSLETLRRGDIIRVPGGRRAGMAVVLETVPQGQSGGSRGRGPNLAPATGGAGGDRSRMAAMAGQGPLVLTANRQVKRLSVADFPVPVEAVDRIKIPGSFSVRSPQHRRDLAASMRNRLAGREIEAPRRAADWDDDRPGAATGQQEIASLRRRLRQHPSHGCPDRDEHARYAERYQRLKRETEALERKVASRSHVIARTFDRVCAVLESLVYLTGDTVTAEGRMLGGLYSELDLLAAECLRRGYWDGLDTQELAACVSALSFESRQNDDGARPRLPSSKVRDVLSRMVRTWGQLDELEKDNHVSFLREPDLGFAFAAYQWAGGARLEDVLSDTDLTPGDFVRSIKQLIDLLDQIAAAPRSGRASETVAETARVAIDAIRRGVVAYTTVTD
ncbi:MAG TPA: DEAD/DEAH box helicase [Streptosporangiaceae bacterium]|nr:DEAD/DEAH box helicase [Streptosporangiaceae bacterium]